MSDGMFLRHGIEVNQDRVSVLAFEYSTLLRELFTMTKSGGTKRVSILRLFTQKSLHIFGAWNLYYHLNTWAS